MPEVARALIDKTRLIKLIFIRCTVSVQVLGITEVCLQHVCACINMLAVVVAFDKRVVPAKT